jgi:hypothetical protein
LFLFSVPPVHSNASLPACLASFSLLARHSLAPCDKGKLLRQTTHASNRTPFSERGFYSLCPRLRNPTQAPDKDVPTVKEEQAAEGLYSQQRNISPHSFLVLIAQLASSRHSAERDGFPGFSSLLRRPSHTTKPHLVIVPA